MKIFFRTIHLYLSLAAGVVIMIACLTGAILVFENELQELFYPQRYTVSESGKRIDLAHLIRSTLAPIPKAKLAAVKVYSDPQRTVEIGLIVPQKDEHIQEKDKKRDDQRAHTKGGKAKAEPQGGLRPTHTAFVNPYTGKMIELYSAKGSFFQKTMALHRWLLGKNGGIGKYIVGVSTFIFLFIILTGIILWWPKTRNILLQRIKVKWDGNWKRLNHDLHLVFGFYSAIFLFIFAFTAMSWSFEWFNKGIYSITNTTAKIPEPPASPYKAQFPKPGIDQVLNIMQITAQDALYYNIRTPKDSSDVYSVTVLPANAAEMETDTYYIDQYTGLILSSLKFGDKNQGQRIRAYIKPLHTSAIYGTPSKIIGFIVCLLGVTFPVTGIIMWLNRLKAERKLSARKYVFKRDDIKTYN